MINIQVDGIEALQRQLSRMPTVLNKALAAGINRTARAIEQHELVALERDIDRPTRFTMNAVRVSEARPKPNPSAVIYVQPLQARYLRYAIEGGRLPTILTPVNIKLNQYGNILGKRGGLEGIAEKGVRRFVATINGVIGVWERYGKDGSKIKLLVMVKRDQVRRERWDFYGIGQRVAEQRLRSDVAAAIEAALRMSAS